MNANRFARWPLWLAAVLCFWMSWAPAVSWGGTGTLAYIGPGPGLGLIGSLLAVLAAVVLGMLGLVLYPLRLYRQWRRGKGTAANAGPAPEAPLAGSPPPVLPDTSAPGSTLR